MNFIVNLWLANLTSFAFIAVLQLVSSLVKQKWSISALIWVTISLICFSLKSFGNGIQPKGFIVVGIDVVGVVKIVVGSVDSVVIEVVVGGNDSVMVSVVERVVDCSVVVDSVVVVATVVVEETSVVVEGAFVVVVVVVVVVEVVARANLFLWIDSIFTKFSF